MNAKWVYSFFIKAEEKFKDYNYIKTEKRVFKLNKILRFGYFKLNLKLATGFD